MTFYWWSHWFWITMLGIIMTFAIPIAYTYPSQELSLEYNQNHNPNLNSSPNLNQPLNASVTKLYQTTTLAWAITPPSGSAESQQTPLSMHIPTLPDVTLRPQNYDSSATTVKEQDEQKIIEVRPAEEPQYENEQDYEEHSHNVTRDDARGDSEDFDDHGSYRTCNETQNEEIESAASIRTDISIKEGIRVAEGRHLAAAGDGVREQDDGNDREVETESERDTREDDRRNSKELEFKRSADNYNKSNDVQAIVPSDYSPQHVSKGRDRQVVYDDAVVQKSLLAASGLSKRKEPSPNVNNYTNYSSTASVASRSEDINIPNADWHSTADAGDDATQRLSTLQPNASAAPLTGMEASSAPIPAGSVSVESVISNRTNTVGWPSSVHTTVYTRNGSEVPAIRSLDGGGSYSDAIAATTTAAVLQKVPFTLENANKEEELRRAESEHRSRKSKVLSAEYRHINRYINFSTDSKNLLTRSAASTAANDFDGDEGNISSEALAIQRTYFLDAGAISAICFTVFGVCCTVGTIGIVLYRRRYLNKPQALSEPDSSVYIDDSTMRDNSDEMYSLDNDSFLNSLEAMTIQNYWTDTVKHTKL